MFQQLETGVQTERRENLLWLSHQRERDRLYVKMERD